jgi:hypothetical protein
MAEDTLWDWYSGKQQPASPRIPAARAAPPLPLIAILLAVLAQYLWQFGPRDQWPAGAALYLVAAALFGLHCWQMPVQEGIRHRAGKTPPIVRWRFVLAALCLAAAAYFLNSNLQFSVIGVLAWAGALAIFTAGFWSSPLPNLSTLPDVPGLLRRFFDNPRVPLIAAGVGGAMLLGAFFRLYNLATVPREMTSDHVEKLLDVARIAAGKSSPIFLPTNGGRESMFFYICAVLVHWLGFGLTHYTLKLAAAVCGVLVIPLAYLLAAELTQDKRLALLAAVLLAVGWWPVVIARNGLRFPLAPLFTALTLWLVVRGLRRGSSNELLLGGLALGLGFYGYSAFRLVPLVVAAVCLLSWLHQRRAGSSVTATVAVAMASIFLIGLVPMARYAVDDPAAFWHRIITRMGQAEVGYTDSAWIVFLRNAWNGARMFSWTADTAWLVSPEGQPALDWVCGALFHLGVVGFAVRYARTREWQYLAVLCCVPILLLPSMLALAFPVENPSLTRSSCALPLVFLLTAFPLRALWQPAGNSRSSLQAAFWRTAAVCSLVTVSALVNYRIIFTDYAALYQLSAQNTSEIGAVVRGYATSIGNWDTVWVRAYPYWVDTRAVGIAAGRFGWDNVILGEAQQRLEELASDPRIKLFIFHQSDGEFQSQLQNIFPRGMERRHQSLVVADKDFMSYFVMAQVP